MARIDDIPEPTRSNVLQLECPAFEGQPFVAGPPLARRRVAIVSSAAIHARTEPAFPHGATEFRGLPATLDAGDIVMSHVSVNFDRHGFESDLNVIYPIDRLRELAAAGVIGSVAATHYASMGATDPTTMAATTAQLVGQLRQDRVDAVLLSPV